MHVSIRRSLAENKEKILVYAFISLMVAFIVLLAIKAPVYADTDSSTLSSAITKILVTVFNFFRSIFAGFCAVVILIRLFMVVTGSPREAEASISKIKTVLVCLVISWLVVPLVSLFNAAGKESSTAGIESLTQ